MKKLILTCALLTSASMLSFAQSTQTSPAAGAQPNAVAPGAQTRQRPTPEQMAEHRAQFFKKQCDLNDDQYKGVYAAELDFVTKMQAMRASGQPQNPDQMKQLSAAKDEKYKAILTPEQYEKYSAPKRQPQPQPQIAPATPPANK